MPRKMLYRPSPHHFELLFELIDKNEDDYITLIVNEIIIEEWKRNKSNAESYVNKLKNKIKEINKTESDYTQFIDTVDKEALNIAFNKVKGGLELQISENINHINEVENFLLNACTLISVSEKSKLKAVNLALSKNAPFHNNKNNMADTLILLSSIEYLEQVLENEDQAYFVSNNTKDFCEPNLKGQFHSDIMNLIKNVHLKFPNNINDVVSVSREVQRELEYLEFLKSDYYLNTIQFECQTLSCKKKDYCSYGYLTDSILVVQEKEALKNRNQLFLFDDFSLGPKLYMVWSNRAAAKPVARNI